VCKVINDKENMTRILLVDDEKDTEYAFALILKAEGYIVDAYNDPVKALLAFKPDYYDLILLDYRMAPLDGLALIQKIRALDRLAKAILVTAWETQYIGNEIRKWFINVLGKPVTDEKLIQEVRLALNIVS
jgi:CheY-like chemotaxis protein